jgi:hypothetical protein
VIVVVTLATIAKYDRVMPIDVEVNLHIPIPTLTIRSADKPDRRIGNELIRFRKRVTVATPKRSESLTLSLRRLYRDRSAHAAEEEPGEPDRLVAQRWM